MQLCRPYVYVLLLGIIAFNVAFAPFTYAEIAFDQLWAMALMAAGLGGVLWARRNSILQGGPVIKLVAGAMEMIVLILLLTLAFRVFDHLTKANAMPLADDILNRMDLLMGLDWMGYFGWVHARTWLHWPLIYTYHYLELAMLVTLIGLFLTGHGAKGRMLIECIVLCSLISVSIGAFFPAEAAVVHYLKPADPSLYADFPFLPGIYHMESLTALRDSGTTFRVGDGAMVGLNTFPSLHTATAVLLLVMTRGTWLAFPAWAFAIPMLMATPIWGGHYFIDIIAGTAMALAVWAALRRGHAPRDGKDKIKTVKHTGALARG